MSKKRDFVKERIKQEHGCDASCQECTKKFMVIDDMDEANIPAEYWMLTMKSFAGSPKLKEIVESYIANLKDRYMSGKSMCLSGSQGTGKTMSAICILRAAIKSGFRVYYLTASDLLAGITDFRNSSELRYRLKNSDFLVIDELDSRFFTSDSVKELFSGVYESIFRHRAQNMLPTIICTNETGDLLNVFYGQGVQSINSLNSRYLEMIPVAGLDFRKTHA
jgi:DNA replication protein DnaC